MRRDKRVVIVVDKSTLSLRRRRFFRTNHITQQLPHAGYFGYRAGPRWLRDWIYCRLFRRTRCSARLVHLGRWWWWCYPSTVTGRATFGYRCPRAYFRVELTNIRRQQLVD